MLLICGRKRRKESVWTCSAGVVDFSTMDIFKPEGILMLIINLSAIINLLKFICVMCHTEAHHLYTRKPIFDAMGIQVVVCLNEHIDVEVISLLKDKVLNERLGDLWERLTGLLEGPQTNSVASQVTEFSKRVAMVFEEGQRSVSPSVTNLQVGTLSCKLTPILIGSDK